MTPTPGTASASAERPSRYRIVRSPYASATQVALARPYSRIEDAVADMGDGLVLADDGHIAAFHERHLRVLKARSARVATPTAGSA